MEEDEAHIIKICDSSNNHSRKTLKYRYNPETDFLGRGGYGKVYRVQIEKEFPSEVKTYAIKIFDKKILKEDKEKGDNVLNEIRIHRSLKHEHICKFEHSFEDKNNVYILMEYCPDGTLLNLLRKREKLTEIEIRFYMFQVLKVLKYFRLQKLVHRDLTLGNIFLKNYKEIKISDFGLAFRENEFDEKSGIICGTPGYFTPESQIFKYSYKTDIFYFGMCIYYLFGGKSIFNTSQQSYDFFSNGEFEPEKYLIKISEEAFDLLKKIITVEGKRIGIDKIYNHPFFKKGKGLDIDSFPNHDDKNYMSQINELSNSLGIKPIEINKKNNSDSSSSDSDGYSKDKKDINDNNYQKRKTYRGSLFDGINLNLGMDKNYNIINENEESKEYMDSKNHINKTKIKTININQIIYVIDFNDKYIKNYGIGYKLNNNNIGFVFNDESQMTKLNNEINYIFYHQKDTLTKMTENLIINIPPKNVAEDILKKIKILFQIDEEFINKKIKYVKNKNCINNIIEDIYVEKYKVGFKCMVFLLSNKNIQVNFLDGIIILFHRSPKALIYFSNNKKNDINIFPLKNEDSFSDIICENYTINYKIKSALSEIKK